MPGRRRDEKRDAQLVRDTTGHPYTRALFYLRGLTGEAREAYLDRVYDVPDDKCGTREAPLCLTCLVPSAGHACEGGKS